MNLKSKLPHKFQKYASFGVIPKLFLMPPALLILGLTFVFRPFFLIQIYPLDWQFGHLISMPHANELRNKTWNRNHLRKKITIYCIDGPIANHYCLKILGRSIWIVKGSLAWLLIFFSKVFTSDSIYNRTDNIIRSDAETSLISFDNHEIKLGEDSVRRFKPIVCLNVRDSSYNDIISKTYRFPKKPWTSRNSDIHTYKEAIDALVRLDFTVFRMGTIVSEPLNINDSKVIDYATNGMRTEFLDFYLGSACSFAISTSSGWDEIPSSLKRPLLLVNVFDFLMSLSKQCIIYPKVFVDTVNGRVLSLLETIDIHLSGKTNEKRHRLENFGIKVRDLSSQELIEAVTEMTYRVKGTFVESPEQKELQAKLKNILSTHPKLQPTLNSFVIRAEFASCFLSRYPNYLEKSNKE